MNIEDDILEESKRIQVLPMPEERKMVIDEPDKLDDEESIIDKPLRKGKSKDQPTRKVCTVGDEDYLYLKPDIRRDCMESCLGLKDGNPVSDNHVIVQVPYPNFSVEIDPNEITLFNFGLKCVQGIFRLEDNAVNYAHDIIRDIGRIETDSIIASLGLSLVNLCLMPLHTGLAIEEKFKDALASSSASSYIGRARDFICKKVSRVITVTHDYEVQYTNGSVDQRPPDCVGVDNYVTDLMIVSYELTEIDLIRHRSIHKYSPVLVQWVIKELLLDPKKIQDSGMAKLRSYLSHISLSPSLLNEIMEGSYIMAILRAMYMREHCMVLPFPLNG
jgi:hypothetical protein